MWRGLTKSDEDLSLLSSSEKMYLKTMSSSSFPCQSIFLMEYRDIVYVLSEEQEAGIKIVEGKKKHFDTCCVAQDFLV